ncbi:hypothetical protein GF361_05380 [Candidatus Woesearchaeota archaeon]|nr:hypothetical protein [Candidatus Woesearchaeota archaeon]
MVNRNLVSYIKQQINAGYDINTIRNFLIRNGYNKKEIDEAVDYTYKRKKGISLPIIIGLILVLIVIIFGVFLMIGGEEETPIETTEIIPEEEISEPGETISEEETFEEEEEGQEAFVPEETTDEEEQPETLCGNNICDFGENYLNCARDCEPVESSPASAQEDGVLFRGEMIERVIALSSSPSKAAGFCADQDLEIDRDICYDNLAEASQESSWCENIVDENRRDGCYAEFVLNGDYTICDKLTNKYLKESCYNLRAI